MALDFPNPPLTVGATYTAAGVTWTWDGVKWESGSTASAYVPIAGNVTVTGSLGIGVTLPTDRSTSSPAVFTNEVALPVAGAYLINGYLDTSGTPRYLGAGASGGMELFSGNLGLFAAASGAADAAITYGPAVLIGPHGNMVLSGAPAIPADVSSVAVSAQAFTGTGNTFNFNLYYATGSQWKYLGAGYGGLMSLDASGNITFWGTSASGAAGAAATTLTETAYLTPAGTLYLTGGLGASGAVNLGSTLTVNGTGLSSIAGSLQISGANGLNVPNGSVNVGGNLSVGGTTTSTGRILTTSSRIISQGGNNPSFISYDTASGTAQGMWSNNGSVFLGSSDGNGNPITNWLNINGTTCGIAGTLQVLGNVITSQSNNTPRFCAYSLNGSVNMGFYVDTTQRMMIANFDGSNNLSTVSMYIQNGSITITNATAGKPGGGAWADSSDPRIKKIHGTYQAGLDALLQLRPIEYSFLGNEMTFPPSEDRPYEQSPHVIVAEAGTRFVGLDASEVEGVMPEMVSKQTAYVDGEEVTDLRYLDPSPLIYAVINALKTIDQRLNALEGALRA